MISCDTRGSCHSPISSIPSRGEGERERKQGVLSFGALCVSLVRGGRDRV